MSFILGRKIEMTQRFLADGRRVPVTRISAAPNRVTQVKTQDRDGYTAIQIGLPGRTKLTKSLKGHLKDLGDLVELKEFRTPAEVKLERGQTLTVAEFKPGDHVKVTGWSKGKGFAGVVKRHHFRGGPASHGHKDNLRMPGSIGSGGVQRVFKGMRMGGRMGGDRVTIKNLEIVQVHPETNELYIKGAVPGGRNALLMISGEGELKVQKAVRSEERR